MNDFEKKLLELENSEIKKSEESTKRGTTIDNKSVLLEILKSNKFDKKLTVIKAASLWFTKSKKELTADTYSKRMISIGNSFDTMKSNFNSKEKVENDSRLKGLTFHQDDQGNCWID